VAHYENIWFRQASMPEKLPLNNAFFVTVPNRSGASPERAD
jgi:hypothetical protein